MRMVDLRPTGTPTEPDLTILASAAAEVMQLAGVLVDEDQPGKFDVGAERIAALRDQLPDGALERLREVDTDPKTFHVLALLAAKLPSPAGIDELLGAVDDDPSLPWRLLLGHHTSGAHGRGEEQLAERVIAGDSDAIDQVRSWTDDAGCPVGLRHLADIQPEEHGRRVAAAVRAVLPVWDQVSTETMGAIERDVSHRLAQRDAGTSVADIVVEASNGYALPSDTVITEVVLMPTYWLRPWIVIGRLGTVELLNTVVADEFVALPSEAPSPTLLKLFKALSDEGRLRLLRRMSCGPISLTEACEEIDVAKATAHHHLSTLRQAGLVVMQGEGRGKSYALREDPPSAARDALASYVQPGR